MKYQQPSFSVSMPGNNVAWPFKPRRPTKIERTLAKVFDVSEGESAAIMRGENTAECPLCGAVDRPGETHIAAGYTDRPRKKVCFGLKDSQ